MATFNSDAIGSTGGLGGLGGGIGGLGLVGLVGINNLLGQNGGFGANNAGAVVLEQNVSELRKDVAGVNTTVEALGNEIAGMFATQNLANLAQSNEINSAIASSAMASAVAAKDAEINTLRVANALQTSIETLSTKNDAQFSTLAMEGLKNTQTILSRIDAVETQNLRDQLAAERRRADNREVEINISNSNSQSQNQIQTLASAISNLAGIVSHNTNSVVAIGSNLRGTTQTASPINVGN